EQFAAWYMAQNSQWRFRVRRIEVYVSHSPCGNIHETCTNALVAIVSPSESPSLQLALIRWDRLWVDKKNPPPSNTSTTSKDILKLHNAGWKPVGEMPMPKGTEEAFELEVKQQELKDKQQNDFTGGYRRNPGGRPHPV